METEIGRDLGEEVRYNALPILAEKLNFDTKTPLSLWKDRTWVELNYAILYSFQKHKVRHFSSISRVLNIIISIYMN
jgi:nitric-oxide synthase